jgi:pyruvate dehydrogenase E1 component beta subunit
LIVVAPSTPADAKGLLKSAIREDNPVIVVEKRLLYDVRGDVPDEDVLTPLGSAVIRRRGTDVTVVGVLGGVELALRSAADLASEGLSAEVIDPRTLKPLDIDTISESVKKTGRVVVVSEDPGANGVASEIITRVIERVFWYLDAPPVRVTGANTPIPYSAVMEREVLPSVQRVTEAIRLVTN